MKVVDLDIGAGARPDPEDMLPKHTDSGDQSPCIPGSPTGSFECQLSRKLDEFRAELLRLHAQEVQLAHEKALAVTSSLRQTDHSEPGALPGVRRVSSDPVSEGHCTNLNSEPLSSELPVAALSGTTLSQSSASPLYLRSTMTMLRRKTSPFSRDGFAMHERWQSKLEWTRLWECDVPPEPEARRVSVASSTQQSVIEYTTAALPSIDAAWGPLCVVVLWIDLICVPLDVSFNFVSTMSYRVFLLLGRCFWSLDALVALWRALVALCRAPRRKDWEVLRDTWGSLLANVALLALEWSMLTLEPGGWELWINAGRAVRLARLARADAKDAIRTLDSWLCAALPALAVDMLNDPHRWFYTAVGAHWATCFWLRGVGTWADWDFALNGLSIVDTLLTVIAALLITCVVIAQTTSHLFALEKSSTRRLQQMIVSFSRRQGMTRDMTFRMAESLRASTRGAAAGRFREEEDMMKHFSDALRQDLLGAIRQPVLTAMELFADMRQGGHGIIRDVANATVSTLVLTREVVFATREAARYMYFVDEGSLRYQADASACFVHDFCSISTDSISCTPTLARKDRISEPALWMDWQHQGECTALCDTVILKLSGEQLFEAISERPASLWHAVRYAARFVSVLNESAQSEVIDDLFKISVSLSDLVDETPCNTHEHFAFISHYKEEAGTEATLMQAELLGLLQAEPSNPANDMVCPIFLDSEDLTNLQTVTEHVKNSRNLVLLLTPDVLRRPWCLLEIATAFKNGVPIVLVRVERPGFNFEYPGEDFYANLRQGGILNHEAAHMLSREGVELTCLETILREVFMHIAVPFSPHRTAAVRQVELADLLKRCHQV